MNNAWYLSPDYPHLDRVPDRAASLDRNHEEYLVFWPARGRALAKQTPPGKPSWKWQQDKESGYQWQQAGLGIVDGRLTLKPAGGAGSPGEVDGYAFMAPVAEADAFPSKCPHCASDWGRRLGVKSPIRDLGSGFQRIMQILGDTIVRAIPAGPTRKLVLFSDSRLDAAKLSTGIKLAHYLDTLRQVAFQALGEAGEKAVEAYGRAQDHHKLGCELHRLLEKQENDGLSPQESDRRKTLMRELPQEVVGELTVHVITGGATPKVLVAPTPPSALMFTSFRDLLNIVRARLLDLGMNPGGPLPSVTRYKPGRNQDTIRWTELFDWAGTPPAYKGGLQPTEENLQGKIDAAFRSSMISKVLYASAARDFESLGLGYLWANDAPPSTPAEEVAASTMRMLAQKWRWDRQRRTRRGASAGVREGLPRGRGPNARVYPGGPRTGGRTDSGPIHQAMARGPRCPDRSQPTSRRFREHRRVSVHPVRVFAPAPVGWLLHDVQSAAGLLAGRTLSQERSGRLLRISRKMR